jgi:dihydrofolate synthase/folylpolyglutamate synthase
VILTPIQNPRAATVDELIAAARRLDVPAHAAPHLPGALAQAEAITPKEGVIVATGSVFLVGELRELVLGEAR